MADEPPPPRPKNRAPPPPQPRGQASEDAPPPPRPKNNPGNPGNPRGNPGGNSPPRPRRGNPGGNSPPHPRRGNPGRRPNNPRPNRPPPRGRGAPASRGGPPTPRGTNPGRSLEDLPPAPRGNPGGGGKPVGGGELPDLPKRNRIGATKPITRQAPPPFSAPGGAQLPTGSGAITPWTGNTMDAEVGLGNDTEFPLAEVVRIITGVQLDTRANVRRYMTTAPHGDGHIEIIYALNLTDMREELVIVVAAPPTGRTPAVKGFGPADMITKLRGYDQYDYDEAIMTVIREARDYLRDYLGRLL